MSFWKKCSSCKKEIGFEQTYFVCSVSTCRHSRKGFHFCSVKCWDAHLGYVNHKESWAVEETSPAQPAEVTQENTATRPPRRRIVSSPPVNQTSVSVSSAANSSVDAQNIKTDTLVVVSKVKKLIKEQCDFNVSKCCIDALTKKVVQECLKGIVKAKEAERKTVMGRDIV